MRRVAIHRPRRQVPQHRQQLAPPEAAGPQILLQLPPHDVLHIPLLILRDEPRWIPRRHRLLLHELIRLLQLRRHLVRVDAQRKVQRVGEDVVVEAERPVEHVPPAAPAVLDLLRPKLPRLQGVPGQLVEQALVHRRRRLPHHREPPIRHTPGGESHGIPRTTRPQAQCRPTAGQPRPADRIGPHPADPTPPPPIRPIRLPRRTPPPRLIHSPLWCRRPACLPEPAGGTPAPQVRPIAMFHVEQSPTPPAGGIPDG